MLSGNKLKKLGKKFRDGANTDDDLKLLEEHRESFEKPLIEVTALVNSAICEVEVPAVVAGRSKRIRSIIRKLARPENSGMDLSRMEDIGGIRVVVDSMNCQDEITGCLQRLSCYMKARDFRERGNPYRAVHIVCSYKKRLIEVQIRTLPQQLWANESESFGELVKEGGGEPEIQEYLLELSRACQQIDCSQPREVKLKSELFDYRSPIVVKLPRLERLLNEATSDSATQSEYHSFLVVYDNYLNELNQMLSYSHDERQIAYEDYRRITKQIDDDRFEMLILNSRKKSAIAVTHPRFFPNL